MTINKNIYPVGGGKTPEAKPDNKTIKNEGWFPNIETDPFYVGYRIPAEYSPELVVDLLELAMYQANLALIGYRMTQQEQGVASLLEVPADKINDESVKIKNYKRAVYCYAKAEILKESETADRRPVAENLSKSGELTEDKYRQFFHTAIRAVIGKSIVEVALI